MQRLYRSSCFPVLSRVFIFIPVYVFRRLFESDLAQRSQVRDQVCRKNSDSLRLFEVCYNAWSEHGSNNFVCNVYNNDGNHKLTLAVVQAYFFFDSGLGNFTLCAILSIFHSIVLASSQGASSYSKILQLLVLRHVFRDVQRKSLSSLSTLSFSMKWFYYLVILQLSVSMPFCHSVILSLCHSAMRQSVLSSLGPSVILLILSICHCAILSLSHSTILSWCHCRFFEPCRVRYLVIWIPSILYKYRLIIRWSEEDLLRQMQSDLWDMINNLVYCSIAKVSI